VRTECKNLNSFRFVEQAIDAEVARQAALLAAGEPVVQATMHFDADRGRTRVLRTKENADDYRYFPDPDLIPLALDPERLERVRRALPELPGPKRARFQAEHGLLAEDARQLAASRALAEFFEAAARAHGDPRGVARWVLRDVLRWCKERDAEIEDTRLEPAAFARLVQLADQGRITTQSARSLLPELLERGGDPEALVRERGLEAVTDAGLLERAVDDVLAAHPEAAATWRGGDPKVLNFLIGQVMRRTQGKADAASVRRILAARLGA
jgi:aspartyl-tRNA(Asn)/glutamyl-tRNA(Gln) amidotransferase subunit B